MISVIPFEIPLYINIAAEGFTNISSHQDFWMKNIRKIWRLQLPRPYGTPWDSYFMSIPYQEPDKLLGGKQKRQNSCINIINVTYVTIHSARIIHKLVDFSHFCLDWHEILPSHPPLTALSPCVSCWCWKSAAGASGGACRFAGGAGVQGTRDPGGHRKKWRSFLPFLGVLCHHWKIGCLGFFLVFPQGHLT